MTLVSRMRDKKGAGLSSDDGMKFGGLQCMSMLKGLTKMQRESRRNRVWRNGVDMDGYD